MKGLRSIAIAGLASVVGATAHAGDIANLIFQVNTYTTGGQFDPDIAFLPRGAYVVVWESEQGGFGDDRYWSIQAQRFARGGEPVGGEFQVNSYTTAVQSVASVATQPSGEFVIAWVSNGSFGDDDWGSSVQARRYDASGEPVGAEVQVNSYTTGGAQSVDLASIPGRGFVVTWTSNLSPGTDDSEDSVHMRRLGLDGSPLGEDFQVNVYTTEEQNRSRVAASGSGFEVVWQRTVVGERSSIWRRRFDLDGTPLGGDQAVSTDPAVDWGFPEVALRPSGEGVVVGWGHGENASGWRFDASGTAVGSAFALGSDVISAMTQPAVAVDADGSVVAAWREGRPDAHVAIEARRFTDDGTAVGEEVLVSGDLLARDAPPAVAFGPARELVIAWHSLESTGDDDSGSSILMTRPQVFAHGFESGDACGWSESGALADPCG